MDKYISRNDILEQVRHKCLVEMYSKAQPMADYDNLVEEYRSGKIQKDEDVSKRHYLSKIEYDYILNKYINTYNIKGYWKDYINYVISYIENGGYKYITKENYTDQYGHFHSSVKLPEKVQSAKDQIYKMIDQIENTELLEDISDKILQKVIEIIKDCQDFYVSFYDKEELEFKNKIISSNPKPPISNKNVVKKWWKDNYNYDVKIKNHIPELFWYYDNDWSDHQIKPYFNHLGENWKEKLWEKWEDQIDEIDNNGVQKNINESTHKIEIKDLINS